MTALAGFVVPHSAGLRHKSDGKRVEKVEEQLGYSGDASLVYAGYPFDPFRPDKSVH